MALTSGNVGGFNRNYQGNAPGTPAAKPGFMDTIQNGLNTVNQGFNTVNNLGQTIQNGFSSLLNPMNSVLGGVSGMVNTATQAWNLGKDIVGGFKSAFGLDKEEKAAQAAAAQAEQQRIVDERNQMMGEEVSDQDRRARAQQYSQTNAYGNVHWEYGPDGTPHQVSTLDDYQQQLKDNASQMAGQIGSQDAVQSAVDANTNAMMEMYHRQNDEQNQEAIRKTQESLLKRGISPDSAAYKSAMMNLQQSQADAEANARNQAVSQGYQYGNQAYQNQLSAFDRMNAFKDPLEQYKEMAGSQAYSQSAVQPAWNYSAGREDSRAEQAYKQQQMQQQEEQFRSSQLHDIARDQMNYSHQDMTAEQKMNFDREMEAYKNDYGREERYDKQDFDREMKAHDYDRQREEEEWKYMTDAEKDEWEADKSLGEKGYEQGFKKEANDQLYKENERAADLTRGENRQVATTEHERNKELKSIDTENAMKIGASNAKNQTLESMNLNEQDARNKAALNLQTHEYDLAKGEAEAFNRDKTLLLQQKGELEQLKLKLADDQLSREQKNALEVKIHEDEVAFKGRWSQRVMDWAKAGGEIGKAASSLARGWLDIKSGGATTLTSDAGAAFRSFWDKSPSQMTRNEQDFVDATRQLEESKAKKSQTWLAGFQDIQKQIDSGTLQPGWNRKGGQYAGYKIAVDAKTGYPAYDEHGWPVLVPPGGGFKSGDEFKLADNVTQKISNKRDFRPGFEKK
jgi:hypothetical protein